MYELVTTSQFKKDLKKIRKRFKDFELLRKVVKNLQLSGVEGISIELKPHKLTGNYRGHFECHVKPDLLIIWVQIKNPKTIKLIRTGSHSDLFK